ncbi:MAG TPA: hypothetical protein H9775_17370 [Candidatus Blautia merdipullorum]|nr:hypothetical protein [Candidatus Blautia merdipullorum]
MAVLKKGVLLMLTASIMIILMGSCSNGVKNKSPEDVVRSLILSYQDQDTQAVKECYGIEEEEVQEDVQKEMDYNMRLFKAYQADKIKFEKSDFLGESGESRLIYVWFTYETEETEKKCPVLSFYYVNKNGKRYYVVPAKDVTEEMSTYSRNAYEKFMNTSTYKNYQEDLKKFQEENPSYKEELDKRFGQQVNGDQ